MWNGPMGISEISEFSGGTESLAYMIADITDLGAYSLIGGGDTISAISSLNLKQRFTYLSTGGGAMLREMDSVLREATGLPISIAEEPLFCVVMGTGRCWEELKTLRPVLIGA